MVGLIVFLGITFVAAVVCHGCIRKYWVASFVAAAVANVVFQIVAYVEQGHLDPFFFIALVSGSFYAFAVSLAVGIPFTLRRRARHVMPGHCKTCGYDLTGNESGICPECATPVPKREAGA